jgi:hypothetical protein
MVNVFIPYNQHISKLLNIVSIITQEQRNINVIAHCTSPALEVDIGMADAAGEDAHTPPAISYGQRVRPRTVNRSLALVKGSLRAQINDFFMPLVAFDF